MTTSPNSLANLRPFRPGFDPNRNLTKPGSGRPPKLKRTLLRWLDEETEHNGSKVTRYERMLAELTLKATGEAEDVSEAGQLRAIDQILNRLHGKPRERKDINHSGQITLTGKPLSEMSDEEFERAKELRRAGTHRWVNDMLVPVAENAEFEEVKNGDSEA